MSNSKKKFIFICALFAVTIVTGTVQSIVQNNANKPRLASDGITQVVASDGVIQVNITTGIFYGSGSSLLGNNSIGVSKWISTIEKARKDDRVKGMLIRMNSPGGTIGASQELYESIVRFRESGKKIVVSIIDLCASGGYYASIPADVIMANPGSLIGSIGVRLSSGDYTELLEKIGVRIFDYKSVPHKDVLSPFRKATEAEKKHLQSLVDTMHEEFVSVILRWREEKSDKKTITEAANGYFYTSQQAMELGLIDKIGDREAAKKELAKLTGLDYEKLRFITYKSDFLTTITQSLGVDSYIQSLFTKMQTPKLLFN